MDSFVLYLSYNVLLGELLWIIWLAFFINFYLNEISFTMNCKNIVDVDSSINEEN